MKKLLQALLLLPLFVLGACGGGGAESGPTGGGLNGGAGDGNPPPRKSVLSHWTLVDYDYTLYNSSGQVVDIRGATIDLRNGVLGTFFSLDFSYNGTVICETQIELTGGNHAGVYRMEGIDCGTLDYQEGTYQIASNSELTLKGLKTKYTGQSLITTPSTEFYR